VRLIQGSGVYGNKDGTLNHTLSISRVIRRGGVRLSGKLEKERKGHLETSRLLAGTRANVEPELAVKLEATKKTDGSKKG